MTLERDRDMDLGTFGVAVALAIEWVVRSAQFMAGLSRLGSCQVGPSVSASSVQTPLLGHAGHELSTHSDSMKADSCPTLVQCEEGPFNEAIGEQGGADPPSGGKTPDVRSMLGVCPKSIRYLVNPCYGFRLSRRNHQRLAIGIDGVSGQRPVNLASAILTGQGLGPSKRHL